MSRGWGLGAAVAILLLAGVLRFAAFGEVPPGLQHDEMFKALEARQFLADGYFRIFYPSNQGHEGGYVWMLAASAALFGANVAAIKFPAFIMGMLTVALTTRLGARLGGRSVGLASGGLLAVSMWGVFTSRVSLRAGMLPVFAALLGLCVISLAKRPRVSAAVVVGAVMGAALYTYTSSFALWAGAAATGLIAVIRARRIWWETAGRWVLVAVIGTAVGLPMIFARVTDPEGFNRSSSITRPFADALEGRPQELIDNGLRIAGMLAFTGDPEARYNIPDRPLFALPVGLIAYAGLAVIVWRARRRPEYAYWVGVIAAGIVPSLLTVSAPAYLRLVALMPAVALAFAFGCALLPGRLAPAVMIAGIGLTAVLDVPAYFSTWAQLPEVSAIYRDDLEQLARHVAADDRPWLVSTPDVEQDALTFSLYASDVMHRVGFFDGDTTVALGEGAVLALSALSPLSPPHIPFAAPDMGAVPGEPIADQFGRVAFERFDLASTGGLSQRIAAAAASPVYVWPQIELGRGDLAEYAHSLTLPVTFGGVVELIGFELADRDIATEFDGVNLQLYLRPLARDDRPLSVFVHVLNRDGTIHAQRDLMGMPSNQWIAGTVIVQDNFVIMGPSASGRYVVSLGIYDTLTGERLTIDGTDGMDRVLLGRVRVRPGD
ncbi:MAG: glycosyltransferase family 39 protein [Chloroflexi bacterium]|nr:glycosyltransferase family 39 protein [Chloroflexota bacterium]